MASISIMLLVCASSYANPGFGDVTDTFQLGAPGLDTAGGAGIDDNYFHTSGGILVMDRNGAQVGDTILLPGGVDVYGVAHDGINLFVSNQNGSKIFEYLGPGNGWTGGLGISESAARGLAASATDFYMIVDDGANIARINKQTGATMTKYNIASIMGEGAGLGYIPATNELIVTNFTDSIYRLKLTPDLSAIDLLNSSVVVAGGMGSNTLVGAGYNHGSRNLVLNDVEFNGQYAEGLLEAYPDLNYDGDVDLADFSVFSGCFNGPNRAPAAGCGVTADLDNDSDVDLSDFSLFAQCFNGPNRAPVLGALCTAF
ncbi:MAG: hypothetical protein JXA69_12065 [Phycisphaerae bacterium]|nr:hypothetical protein [Phycisphaerae bacterium]